VESGDIVKVVNFITPLYFHWYRTRSVKSTKEVIGVARGGPGPRRMKKIATVLTV